MLCELGHLDEAENGEEAVYKFAEARKEGKPYSVIIMDYQMPVMDGCEALYLIRKLEMEHDPDKMTTVYISSGHTNCRDVFNNRMSLDPFVKFISKPFNYSNFINDITVMGIQSPPPSVN